MQTAFPHVRATKLGSRINVTTSSVSYTLPFSADGTLPRFCRLIVEPTAAGASSYCYVNVGDSAVTAQAGNICITSTESLILQTRGMGYIAVFNPATTANLSLTPLEDC